MSGNSQAVRIPREFRLASSHVEISREKNGDLLIHPIPEDRGSAILGILASFGDDFVKVLQEHQAEQSEIQDREAL